MSTRPHLMLRLRRRAATLLAGVLLLGTALAQAPRTPPPQKPQKLRIVGMANNLGLRVIALGIETTAQQEFLAANGCTLCQGYLFGRPTPLSDFEALLASAQALP